MRPGVADLARGRGARVRDRATLPTLELRLYVGVAFQPRRRAPLANVMARWGPRRHTRHRQTRYRAAPPPKADVAASDF